MRVTKYITFFMAFIFLNSINSQIYLNLDFEISTQNGKAKGWYQGGEGYSVFVDSATSFSGKNSLCIQSIGNGNFGVATSSFPIEDARGKYLKYSGYIKTEDITNGYAGLWWRVDGKDGMLNFDNMSDRGAKGTNDWAKYSIEFKVDENLTNINFGVLLPGNGKAWFDNLQIEFDGVVYEQKEPEVLELSIEQINWLRKNVNSFQSSSPSYNNEDLKFLEDLVGDAKIVSLGEGTHGTSEFFKMKHRITKYLAEEMGFTVFAIEANMPEAQKVNEYVLTGKGNSKEALSGLYFWTWNTQEVLDMIEWMRGYNSSKKGRIEFWGFDMQYPNIAIENTLDFIKKYDSNYYEKANENYQKINLFKEELRKMKSPPSNVFTEPYFNYAKEVHDHLLMGLSNYKKTAKKDSVEWAIQNARIVVQSIEAMMQNYQSRDESMALNVQWILNQKPEDTKVILWAHNGHVSKRKLNWLPMGAYLNDVYKNDMLVMGFCFHQGNYTAVGKNGLGIYSTSLSEPGSVEWILHSLDIPRLFLDLREINNSSLSEIFDGKLEFRSIGAMAMDYAFNKTNITDEFDVLIYIDKTGASDCFGFTSK
ncbi:erythromycin esterase family protein [Bacteroidota bacterium]